MRFLRKNPYNLKLGYYCISAVGIKKVKMGVISLVYSGISFLLELWVFIMFTGQVIFDMAYKFLFPPEPKGLDGEVILVSYPHFKLK